MWTAAFDGIDLGDRRLVHGATWTFQPGECVALVGESGSGKSLTGLAFMDLLPDGITTQWTQTMDLRAAMIFQEPMSALNPSMRVGKQVAEAAQARLGMPQHEARARTLEWFERVQIPDPESSYKKYPHQMSGGQRQRVMMALAMIMEPDLLIADEPTTALDEDVAHDILSLIRELQTTQNMAMLFISHDLGAVTQIADRVVVMREGHILESGDAKQVLESPSHAYTKGLIASRPPADRKPLRLPTVEDFMEGRAVSSEERPAYQPGEIILEIKGLSKSFKGHAVVKDFDLTLHEGETVGLVGASGSGKSTIARCLVNLTQPDQGEILYRGERIDQLSGRARTRLAQEIQYIFQDPFSSLSPRMTIGEAIREPLAVHALFSSRTEQEAEVIRLLEAVGFEPDVADRYPHEFSGGQRQRIGIARALALRPKLVICDESVAALDVSIQAQVLNLLNDLKDAHGFSYLFISHDARVVDYMSNRIVELERGK